MVAYSTDRHLWSQVCGETRFNLTASTVKSLPVYYSVSSVYRASKIHMTNSYFLTNNKNFENYIYIQMYVKIWHIGSEHNLNTLCIYFTEKFGNWLATLLIYKHTTRSFWMRRLHIPHSTQNHFEITSII